MAIVTDKAVEYFSKPRRLESLEGTSPPSSSPTPSKYSSTTKGFDREAEEDELLLSPARKKRKREISLEKKVGKVGKQSFVLQLSPESCCWSCGRKVSPVGTTRRGGFPLLLEGRDELWAFVSGDGWRGKMWWDGGTERASSSSSLFW